MEDVIAAALEPAGAPSNDVARDLGGAPASLQPAA
jgi:hypothetical protein